MAILPPSWLINSNIDIRSDHFPYFRLPRVQTCTRVEGVLNPPSQSVILQSFVLSLIAHQDHIRRISRVICDSMGWGADLNGQARAPIAHCPSAVPSRGLDFGTVPPPPSPSSLSCSQTAICALATATEGVDNFGIAEEDSKVEQRAADGVQAQIHTWVLEGRYSPHIRIKGPLLIGVLRVAHLQDNLWAIFGHTQRWIVCQTDVFGEIGAACASGIEDWMAPQAAFPAQFRHSCGR